METCTLGQTHVPDLQPTSGKSVTLCSQTSGSDQLWSKPSLPSALVRKLFPGLHQKLWHTITEPRTSALLPGNPGDVPQDSRESATVVPYLTFPAVVGKNSAFSNLTQEQLEELGGLEFRALNMLMWAVPLVCSVCFPCHSWLFFHLLQYYFFSLAIPFIILAPYMSQPRWADNFLIPNQHRNISPVW